MSSGLFAALHVSSTALDAFTRALGVTQENIANTATPGYAARKATIATMTNTGLVSGGDVVQVTSQGDDRADAIVREATSQSAWSQTSAEQLSPLSRIFDITGSGGILAAFQQFSTAFASLSVSPNDSSLQATALSSTATVATAFRQAAIGIDSVRTGVDSEIDTTTQRINALAARIAGLNRQAAGQEASDAGVDTTLRTSLDELASLVDIRVTKSPDGAVSVLAGGQLPLVLDTRSFQLSVDTQVAPDSQVSSSAGGNAIRVSSGKLGALLGARNTVLDPLLGSGTQPGTLNTLAAGFASRVNTLLSSGTTPAGAPGVPVYSYDSTNLSNAARTIDVISSITPDQLALATTGASGQANALANQLAALPSSGNAPDLIQGQSPQDLFSSIAAGIGQSLAGARAEASTDQTILVSTQAVRARTTQVSLDEEAVNVTALQRAYEAAARVVSIIDQLTSDEVNLIK